MSKKICPFCEKNHQGQGIYCSQSCAAKLRMQDEGYRQQFLENGKKTRYKKGRKSEKRKPKVSVTCEGCGKEYKVHPYRANTTKYCSRSCLGRATISDKIERPERVELECEFCKKVFYRPPSLVEERRYGNFCSVSCFGEYSSRYIIGERGVNWQGGKVTIKCERCNKKVKRTPAAIKGKKFGNYCSRRCWNKTRARLYRSGDLIHPREGTGPKVEKECEFCGKSMTVYEHRIKEGRGKYCSKECFNEDRKGQEPWNKGMKMPPEFVKKCLTIRSPNKAEQKLDNWLQEHFPGEWRFVGDGKVIIDGKCPDFINKNGQKKIIELFGEYWHEEDEISERRKAFSEYGYETLFIWDSELKDKDMVLKRINKFTGEERA